MNTDKIYLIGFMGTGRTTNGHELADQLRWDFENTDLIAEEKERMSVDDILKTKGELYFRRLEALILQELLPRRTIVIATGGGAFPYKESRELMLRSGLVVWPFVPLNLVGEWLSPSEEIRKKPEKEIEKLSKARRAAYGQAHMVVNGDGTPQEIAEDIIRQRRKYL